jgi:hypothetical protein
VRLIRVRPRAVVTSFCVSFMGVSPRLLSKYTQDVGKWIHERSMSINKPYAAFLRTS